MRSLKAFKIVFCDIKENDDKKNIHPCKCAKLNDDTTTLFSFGKILFKGT